MTRREERWLVVGILAGVLLAGAAGAGLWFWFARPPMPSTSTATDTQAVVDERTEAVQLSDAEQSKIGLETVEVRSESLSEDITAIGRVAEPESALATVSTRFGGRVERFFINFTGQPIQKGDPIAVIAITGQPAGKEDPVSSIYSRDLIAAAAEYKFALENRQRAHAASRPDAAAQADALVEASRVRLERLGLTVDQIDKLPAVPAAAEEPILTTVNSTASGIVASRKVREGEFVNPGGTLIEVTDLQTVWVKADVFDSDIARIRPGLTATISSEALPGLRLSGAVDFIEPQADPQTRTTPVRLQVANPGTRLRPGMVVQCLFRLSLGSVLTAPREAVIDTGTEKFVYIARDNGIFEKRTIKAGNPVKERYPVTEGLAVGDRIVAKGVFLVDSQTQLTGGLTGLFGGSKSYAEPGAAPSAGSGHKITFRIDPNPPQGAKENTVHVTLTDSAGKPVSDAQVRMTFVMPAMPAMNMPEMRNGAELKWTGSGYTGPIQIMMAGGWNVTIEARRGGEMLATYTGNINAK